MSRDAEKARKYLALLDEARCNDRWTEVPELARKIAKHAPARQCLAHTARAEAEQASRNPGRPLTGSLSEASITSLRTDIEQEKDHAEDAYQARACLAQALWEEGKKEEVISILSVDPPKPQATAGKTTERPKLQGWTYVVAVRSAYLKERCYDTPDERGTRHEALYKALETAPSNVQKSEEFCIWMERFLLHVCLKRPNRPLWTGREDDKKTTERFLAPFRAWMRFWDVAQGRKPSPGFDGDPNPHRQVWAAYYDLLSQLLRSGFVYTVSSRALLNDVHGLKAATPRAAQTAELRRVEAVYEGIILRESSFPDADKINKEIDDWADQVMDNWSILCGEKWRADDLAYGGREGTGRHAAEVLYRAATRTYHSCAILRHLFAVHASLGEFQLAAKALDSYLDLVLKGKNRVEKTGKSEPNLDSDEAVVQTISNGVEMHCNYGKLAQSVRAEQLCGVLQDWLSPHDNRLHSRDITSKPEHALQPFTIALIHRTIGMSKANYTLYTLDASERTDLQEGAIRHLRQSLIAEGSRVEDPRTLYALALMLAETRDTDGAIASVKQALSAHSQLASEESHGTRHGDQHRRILTPMGIVRCWHLLALLLSARQDYEKAEAACDAALDSFEDEEHMPREVRLRQLSYFEKQQIVETNLTQAMLFEIGSNWEAAINAGRESLRLYAYLFNVPAKKEGSSDGSTKAPLPLKHRGSLFHRRKAEEAPAPPSTAPGSVYSNRISDDTSRPPTMANVPEGTLAPPGTSSSLSHSPSHKLQKHPSKRSIHRERLDGPFTSDPISATAPQINGVELATTEAQDVGVAVSHDLPTAIASQLESITVSHLPPLSLSDGQNNPQRYSARVTYPPMPPLFPAAVDESYALGLLSSIWVFISGLYRRAGLYEDAIGAVDEALKVAQQVEGMSAKVNSSASQFEEEGWGGARSVDWLWADAYAASGYLHHAQHNESEARAKFETSLSFFPDHPVGTVGLSNLLLDIYAHKPPKTDSSATHGQTSKSSPAESSTPVLSAINALQPSSGHRRTASSTEAFPSLSPFDPGIAMASVGDAESPARGSPQSKPRDLDRLAARDRAFGLLSSLTKLGTSWDDSDAWFALARSYEESGEPEKARDVLWWVVELEERKPVRRWSCLGPGFSC